LNVEAAADLIWNSAKRAEYYPQPLHGKLDFDTALKVQLAILDRRIAEGEQQAGWKIGLTSPAVRAHFNTESQPFGYLMTQRIFESGSEIEIDTVGAVAAVIPGMELNEKRSGGVKDFGLAIADNLTQWDIVKGAPVSPVPENFDSDSLEVSMTCNGEVRSTEIGKDVIDDHFVSLATLANTLHRYGRTLDAGQYVITGSFSKHDASRGDTWEAAFAGLGSCRVRFT